MGMTLADIKAQEEKLKKEQAKLRQQKKRLIERFCCKVLNLLSNKVE